MMLRVISYFLQALGILAVILGLISLLMAFILLLDLMADANNFDADELQYHLRTIVLSTLVALASRFILKKLD